MRTTYGSPRRAALAPGGRGGGALRGFATEPARFAEAGFDGGRDERELAGIERRSDVADCGALSHAPRACRAARAMRQRRVPISARNSS
ncbi:MAG TPA: hypothetical protein VF059_02790, partial [Casimicrobiaceae bacterium]